ncbi:methyl-accepting chemotaxis protein [Motilimonas eburnea]|uniref:methyl-accepting chemotaxis protein n=1 Tax=Motilimonas eburnea TaxID=1737488 RepID=UPI001E4D41F3|nr:methyl-accepting chemotaxis protein [Motilimonas eburnea]MCE2571584.1 methyl-accepting chemotaxis protein [Motilimonas eburnea]
MFVKIQQSLLLQVMLAVLLVVALQTLITVNATKGSIHNLVENLNLEFTKGDSATKDTLAKAQQLIANAMAQSTQVSQQTVTKSLAHGFDQAQQETEQRIAANEIQSAKAQAQLLVAFAPPLIWDKDVPRLTELIIAAHQNPKVLFAVFYGADGKYLTRHIDRSSTKVKSLIAQGKGKRKMDKLINAATQDKQIHIVTMDINPKGSVIGKLVMGVDTSELSNLKQTLTNQFDQLTQVSSQKVSQAIDNQAAQSKQALAQSLDLIAQGNKTTANNIQQAVFANSQGLVSDLWLILLISSLVLLIALGLILGNRILKKINLLTQSLVHLASAGGDLTQSIPVQSQDEIGKMADSINAFLNKTRNLIKEANRAADQTSAQSQAMEAKSEQALNALTHQRQEVDNVTHAMTQVVDTIAQENSQVEAVMQSIDQVKMDSEQNSATAQQVKALIEQLVERVNASNQNVGQFEQLSNQIGNVIDVIQGIAEQTNLLALNAAIEAARAGESGRGFAVVADEVRTLASRTQSSTLEIQQNIDSLQQQVRSLVDEMQSTTQCAHEGITKLNKADELQAGIFTSIASLYAMIEHIVTLSQQQTRVTQDVQQSTQRMQTACVDSVDTVSQAQQMSVQLASLSSALKQTMSQFKVE